MKLLGTIVFVTGGLIPIVFGIIHEITWWKRRAWIRGRGVIVGHRENRSDGLTYHPEIEFQGSAGIDRFVSKYSSSEKIPVGTSVEIRIDQSGASAEQFSLPNRFLFTLIPVVFGVAMVAIGFNIEDRHELDKIDESNFEKINKTHE